MRVSRSGLLLAAASATLAVALAVDPAAGTTGWQFQTLNTTVSYSATSSLVFDGQQHVFAQAEKKTCCDLGHLWEVGPTWQSELLDGPDSSHAGHTDYAVGVATTVINYAKGPNVFYCEYTQPDRTGSPESGAGTLRHAWWTGSSWLFEDLDGPGSSYVGHITDDVCSADASLETALTAVVFDGQLQVYYPDATIGKLRHAWYDGSTWQFETLDGRGAKWFGHTSDQVGANPTALLYRGVPEVFYWDVTTDVLRQAYWNGKAWRFNELATMSGHNDEALPGTISAVVWGDQLLVFFHDHLGGTLRQLWYDGSWGQQTLDGPGGICAGADGNLSEGAYVSAAVYESEPHVFYLGQQLTGGSTEVMRHAWWDGNHWHCEVVDGTGSTYAGALGSPHQPGSYDSALVDGDQLHDFYRDNSNGTLRHAWYTS